MQNKNAMCTADKSLKNQSDGDKEKLSARG